MSLNCLILAAVVIAVQCSVIKIQQIPISDDLLMKIVVKEGSSDHSHKIASIKIDLEQMETDEEPPKYTRDKPEPPINDLMPPDAEEEIMPPPNHPRLNPKESTRPEVSKDLLSVPTPILNTTEIDGNTETKPQEVPEFENRFGIGSEVCADGKVRRGPYCITLGK